MKNVAFASKLLLPMARGYLFNTLNVSIEQDVQGTRLYDLSLLLVDQPYLTRSVRRLEYNVASSGEPNVDLLTFSHYKTFLNLPHVSALSISCQDPKIHLSGHPAAIPRFGWRTLLHHYLPAGTLTTLVIQGIGVLTPILDILSTDSLRDFTLDHCMIRPAEAQKGQTPFPLLKRLSLEVAAFSFALPREPRHIYEVFNHLHTLESLKIYGSEAPLLDIFKSYKLIEHLLKTLEIEWDFCYGDVFNLRPGPFEVQCTFKRLEKLRLQGLQHFTLNIKLEIMAHHIYHGERSCHALAKVMSQYQDIFNTCAFPALRTAKIGVVMTVLATSAKSEEAEEYRKDIKRVLEQGLEGFVGEEGLEVSSYVDVFVSGS
ncbi:hypothetical protein CVT24_013330 [Panaeolus cyanescens]|uniref:F-box domain-containing protein n=1 Tax=Panaeolus cyanescens TaxID=181874 RepID=A0A409X259_9AGAR|nr:hypothetical protein CVT24_013330 [Panaeolus cyanescens]